jgi:hypothetical protein
MIESGGDEKKGRVGRMSGREEGEEGEGRVDDCEKGMRRMARLGG